MKTLTKLLSLLCLTLTGPTEAYEIGTHGALTLHAFQRSALGATDRALLKDLGLDGPPPLFNTTYFDMMGTEVLPRQSYSFESNFLNVFDIPLTSIQGWMMSGAIREDDAPGERNPQDDPFNASLYRPLHHFFDPYNDQPLDVLGLSYFDSDVHKAPDWAVGSRDSFETPNAPETDRRNHFTVFDAREAMYRALTLWGKNPDSGYTDLDTSSNAVSQERLRKEYWATTFRALGDVLHLIQDMAQPQHTRNEPHTGRGAPVLQAQLTGHASYFEKYIEARALGATSFVVNGTPITLEPLAYGPDYPVPRFANYSDYWSTSPGAGSLSGQGLADYSNRGFFTPTHNLGNWTYDSPSNDPDDYQSVPADYDEMEAPRGTRIEYLMGAVPDTYTNLSTMIRMTTRSLWDQALTIRHMGPIYSLNHFNYDDMAALLIPRAVAYSAGLINYFFRGKMEISLPDEGIYGIVDHSTFFDPNSPGTDPGAGFKGFDKIKLKLRNITPDSEAMSGGRLLAVVKFRRNLCYQDDLEASYPPLADGSACRSQWEEIVVSDAQEGVALTGEARPFEFTFPKAVPINAIDVRLQMVYRGALGQESDAVVVATKDIAEPTFFTYMNASDYIHIDGKVYTRDEINQSETLLAQVDPQSCVDRSANPPRLRPDCFTPFPITMTFSFGSKPTHIEVGELPPQRFARIAFLADTPDVAMLAQSGPCPPLDSLQVDPVEWQETYDAAAATITLTHPISSSSAACGVGIPRAALITATAANPARRTTAIPRCCLSKTRPPMRSPSPVSKAHRPGRIGTCGRSLRLPEPGFAPRRRGALGGPMNLPCQKTTGITTMKLRFKTALMALMLFPLGAPSQAQPEYPAQTTDQPYLLLALDDQGNVQDTRHGIGFEPAANGVRFEEKAEKVPGSVSEAPEAPRDVKIRVKPAPKAPFGGSAATIPMPRPPAAGDFSPEGAAPGQAGR